MMMTKEEMVAKAIADLNTATMLARNALKEGRNENYNLWGGQAMYIQKTVLGEMLGVEVDEIVGDKGHKRYVVKTGKEVR